MITCQLILKESLLFRFYTNFSNPFNHVVWTCFRASREISKSCFSAWSAQHLLLKQTIILYVLRIYDCELFAAPFKSIMYFSFAKLYKGYSIAAQYQRQTTNNPLYHLYEFFFIYIHSKYF